MNRPRSGTVWLATAMVVLVCTVGASPASAATGERADRAGDAPRIIDITTFRVRNGETRAVITSHVPGLRTRGGFAFGYSTSRYGGLIVFANKVAGELVVEAKYCGEVRCHTVHCQGIRVRWSTAKHLVRAIVPQRCYPATLPSPGVFTATSASRTGYDSAGALRVGRG